MVSIGRAMMSNPQILMLDEPSLGLSPLLCKELFQNLREVKKLGIGILLVEQNAKQSLAIADRGYLLENTRITHEDSAANLARDTAVQKAYLGARAKSSASAVAAPTTETASPASREPFLRPDQNHDALLTSRLASQSTNWSRALRVNRLRRARRYHRQPRRSRIRSCLTAQRRFA